MLKGSLKWLCNESVKLMYLLWELLINQIMSKTLCQTAIWGKELSWRGKNKNTGKRDMNQ